MFIPDFAHQLLQNVFHGDQSVGAAVFVQHHGHVGFGLLQLPQQVADFFAGQHEFHRAHQFGQGPIGNTRGGEKVLLMNDAADVVNGFYVNRQPGIAAFGEGLGDLLPGSVHGHGFDVQPVSENIAGFGFVKGDGVAQKLALVLVDGAFLLHLVHQHHQLFLRHAGIVGGLYHPVHQLLPLGEQEIHRGKHRHQHPQKGRGEHGEAFGIVLGGAFGGNFAEDQHHHRQHNGGNRRAHIPQQPHEQNRAQGSGGDVDDVVADQYGRQKLVVIFGKGKRKARLLVAVFGHCPQTGSVQGGKGCFRS